MDVQRVQPSLEQLRNLPLFKVTSWPLRSCWRKLELSTLSAGVAAGLDIPTKFHRTSLCKHACTGSAGVELNLLKKPIEPLQGPPNVRKCVTCPIFVNKIQEIRRQEIAHAMAHFYSQKKEAVMITPSHSHTHDEALKDLLKSFKRGFKAVTQGWHLVKKIESYWLCWVDSLAWNYARPKRMAPPHTRAWFVNENLNEEEFKEFIFQNGLMLAIKLAWLLKISRMIFLKHAIDIKFNCSTSDYLAKFDDKSNWGIDREIAKASTKKGKNQVNTLLRWLMKIKIICF